MVLLGAVLTLAFHEAAAQWHFHVGIGGRLGSMGLDFHDGGIAMEAHDRHGRGSAARLVPTESERFMATMAATAAASTPPSPPALPMEPQTRDRQQQQQASSASEQEQQQADTGAGGAFTCIQSRTCTRDDLTAVTAKSPPKSPGAALYVVNEVAKLKNSLFGNEVVNDLMTVVRDNPALLDQTSFEAHRAFQQKEFDALQGTVYKEKLTQLLTKVSPEDRADLSFDVSKLRDADSRIIESFKSRVKETWESLSEAVAEAQQAMDEL